MKHFYKTLALLFVPATTFAQTSDLFISKYAEGSANNKFIEIYNGTGAAVSLDNYAFPTASNGTTTNAYEFWNKFTPGATIADGDVFVIAHPSADAVILAASDMTYNFLSNGDDGFALVLDNGTFNDANGDMVVDAGEMTGFTVLDRLGDFGVDPGSGWDVAGTINGTRDHTLTRKSSVCGPNSDWDSSRGFDSTTMTTTAAAAEWIVTGQNTGWTDLGSFTGCSTTPVVTITSPGDGAVLPSGTTMADLVFSAQNEPAGATYDVTFDGNTTTGATSPFTMTVMDGSSYTAQVDMMVGGSSVASSMINFSVSLPCDLQVGTITETCDASTAGVDTYTVTIDYTGGGTTTYTVDTQGNGTVAGDDPSTVAAGQISITGITEGTNFTITFTGDASNSSCNFTRSITSPACIGNVTCPNPGDLIVTEIMKNPSAVGDNVGEYFEVYNTTSSPIDMQGFEIGEDGATAQFTVTALTVPANGYVVFGINADMSLNGGVNVDYEYTNFNLGNGSDEVILTCNGTTIDQVFYTDADFPDTPGTSMELSINSLNATDNDLGANWGDSATALSGGDNGTPGAANSFTLSNNTVDVANFNIYPNPVNGQYLHISGLDNNETTVRIYSNLGQEMLVEQTTANKVDVSALTSGLYFVNIENNGATVTRKLIVK